MAVKFIYGRTDRYERRHLTNAKHEFSTVA